MLKKVIGIIICILIIALMIYGITTGNTGLPILAILLIRVTLLPLIEKC